ncbi:MAG: hypothetical protein VKI83_12660 [Synechococcaceae cyanobacterium]|nr:hypothetical protein [Synechococcaceae cyanobacterium]
MALSFVLAYWQAFLMAGLLILAIVAVVYALLLQNHRQLQALVEAADRRVREAPCQVKENFGVIQSLKLAGDLQTPRVDVRCRTITSNGKKLTTEEVCISLSLPAERQQLRTGGGVAKWLRGGGITQLQDLCVESKAVKAAMECLREWSWTNEAVGKIDGLRTSVIDTLGKAKGNELLEGSIPQLQQALEAFDGEREKLQQANRNASEMLRKLHDFLNVPAEVRPILNFDFDQLFDPQRFSALEQSFTDVVLLNDAFRQLSEDRLA